MKAILLAGGQGTRLRPLTINTPKPIVPIFNRPFLHYQIDLLKQVPEIDEVILSLNYQPQRIEEIFGDGSALGIGIRYVVEPQPLGTGGAVKYAADGLTESVVVFNGDVLTQIDLAAVIGTASGAESASDDRADARGQPDRLRARRDRCARQCAPISRKAARRRDHDQPYQRGHLRPRTRHLRPHACGRALLDRAGVFSVARRARRDLRRAHLPGLLDRHRHTRKVHPGPSRHHGRSLRRGALRRPGRLATKAVSPGARVDGAAVLEGPCFIDEGVVIKAGRASARIR